MSNFSSSNSLAGTQQATAAAYKTGVNLAAATATLTSARVYDFLVGTPGTPGDQYMEYDISRTTGATAGTSTAATASALDSSQRAAGTVTTVNYSAEPTVISSSVFYIAVNQRASFRWVAAPGGELVIPATNLNGFVLRYRSSAYTGNTSVQAYFSE